MERREMRMRTRKARDAARASACASARVKRARAAARRSIDAAAYLIDLYIDAYAYLFAIFLIDAARRC